MKNALVCLWLNRGFVMIHKPTLFVHSFLKRHANDRTNVGQEDLLYDPIDLMSLPMSAGIHGSATAESCLDPIDFGWEELHSVTTSWLKH